VIRETTKRRLCGLVCPSRTSERGGEGYCVKGGGGEEGERERERVREVRLRCVCLLLQYLIHCVRGGRRIVEDMCYEIRRAEASVD
jgi:hypothetical protein